MIMMKTRHGGKQDLKLWMERLTVFILLVIGVLGCARDSDEEKIRALIADGGRLAEAHDIAGLMDLGTAELLAMPMELDRREIKAALWRTFRYYGPLRVVYPRPTVDIRDDSTHATARFPFLILRKEQILPDLDTLRDDPAAWLATIGENADLYRIYLELIRQDNRWRVDRVTIERYPGN